MSAAGENNKVIIKILGEEYIIRSSSSREHMLEVGDYVSALMEDLLKKYPRMSTQNIAVLTSLNLASELILLQKKPQKGKGGGK